MGLGDHIVHVFPELLLGHVAQVESKARPSKHFQFGCDCSSVLSHARAQEPYGSFDLVSLLCQFGSAAIGDWGADIMGEIACRPGGTAETLVSIMEEDVRD